VSSAQLCSPVLLCRGNGYAGSWGWCPAPSSAHLDAGNSTSWKAWAVEEGLKPANPN